MTWIILLTALFFVPLAVIGGLVGECAAGPTGAFIGALAGLLLHCRD